MTTTEYVQRENARLRSWKRQTANLPDGARAAGSYTRSGGKAQLLDVCLPRQFAQLNLLPQVREGALALFRELDIPWHDGVDDGPSNHLRDSQVQCVNALYPMVNDPQRIVNAFGEMLDIADVLMIEAGRFLTFEFIGETDYFGEGRGLARRRGSRCTSVDAAFRYRTSRGSKELALVEWKYTEAYPQPRSLDAHADEVRRTRYESDANDPRSPVDTSLVPFSQLLDEPFYQLLRQQLLAHRLHQDPNVSADVVRVVHVLSPANTAYQECLHGCTGLGLGTTVDEVWSRILRVPDLFKKVDPVVFLDVDVTYADYVERYGHEGGWPRAI